MLLHTISLILTWLYVVTYNSIRLDVLLQYDMMNVLYCAVIYAYICSMVKDRKVASITPHLYSGHARSPTARGYGAVGPHTYR